MNVWTALSCGAAKSKVKGAVLTIDNAGEFAVLSGTMP